MSLSRVKQKVTKIFKNRNDPGMIHNQLLRQSAEAVWAHTFHDTIKSKPWLKDLAISPGRWAGNYSFLYILVRILGDYKPRKIVEFGLGESSKLVSEFLNHELTESTHLIIEQDKNWLVEFENRVKLSTRSFIKHHALVSQNIKSFQVNYYDKLEESVDGVFDFYLIDGPFGSPRYSRYQICHLAEKIKAGEEFIILLDDYDRQGEQDTGADLQVLFARKGIKVYKGVYAGAKSQLILATEKYRFVTSL